jgi:hypothetical protein
MKEITITYQEKEYTITEPSIEIWTKLAAYKDILDESQFLIQIIKESTGLSDADIRKADWFDIMSVGSALAEYLSEQSNKFENEFVFKGKKYRFIDLPNLSFGEFIDIDTVLSKPEHERKTSLPLMMALFYREVGENNKIVEYDSARVQERAELFKQLPIRYVHGALGFFLRLEKILQKPSLKYLVKTKWLKMKRRVKKQTQKVFRSIGGGLESLQKSLIKMLPRWVKSRNTH